MNQIRYILAAIALVSTLQLSAQEKDSEPRIAPDGRQLLLTSKDKDFLQLWFYERMLEMSLDPQGREDYSSLLTYYTYRMGRITLPKYEYTEAEQQAEFDRLVREMNKEMHDFLSKEDYKIHVESFTKIEEMLYKKRGWTKDTEVEKQ